MPMVKASKNRQKLTLFLLDHTFCYRREWPSPDLQLLVLPQGHYCQCQGHHSNRYQHQLCVWKVSYIHLITVLC